MSTVSKTIKRLRTQNNITQDQLAEKMNVTRQAVSNWETEKTQPDIETLNRLADIFKTDITELIYGVPKGSYPRYQKKYVRTVIISLTIILCMLLIHELLVPYLLDLANDIHFKYRDSRFFSIFHYVFPVLSEGIGSLALGFLVPSVVSLFFDTRNRKQNAILFLAVLLSVPLFLTISETILWYIDIQESGNIIYYSLIVHKWFRFLFLWVCTFISGVMFFLASNKWIKNE